MHTAGPLATVGVRPAAPGHPLGRGGAVAEDWPRRPDPSYLGVEKAEAVPEPIIVRVTRPYRSVEEYLEAEADTIDSRGMLLVGADPLPKNTTLRFVVSLASGEQLIRAEGVARSHAAASPASPGGLRVWFKRFGVATKAIIDHAAAVKARAQGSPSQPVVQAPSAPGAESSGGSASDLSHPVPPPGLDALRARPRGSVPPPPNREELLGRLRARVNSPAETDTARKR
jgi:hypothetical protein